MKERGLVSGCTHHSDCLTCPFPVCKLDARYPNVLPTHLRVTIEAWQKRLSEIVDNHKHNWGVTALMRLRRKKSYQNDIKEYRRELEIPIEGYTRREVKKNFKQMTIKEIAREIFGGVMDFAVRHPFDEHHHMPFIVAFEEIFYKRPRLIFPSISGLDGFYNKDKVYIETVETDNFSKGMKLSIDENSKFLLQWKEAPDEITRLIRSKIRGDKNRFTDCVKIVEMHTDKNFAIGFWSIIKELPLS